MLHAWIALLAILFSTFAPTVSRALAAASVETVEICTLSGSKLINISANGEQSPAVPRHSMQHCAFCSVGAGTYAILGWSFALLAVVPWRDVPGATAHTVPAVRQVCHAGNPRAPPLCS